MFFAGVRPRDGAVLAWDNRGNLIKVFLPLSIRRKTGIKGLVCLPELVQRVAVIHMPLVLRGAPLARPAEHAERRPALIFTGHL